MTQCCLVRHGQTEWNVKGIYSGQSDIDLTETGRAQAAALGEKLRGQPFSAIYASDLIRARETAEIIAAEFNLPVQTDSRLREIHQGEWEGLHVDEIQSRYADLWQEKDADPALFRPPGGETIHEVSERVFAAVDEIVARHPDSTVLIVSHGLAIATLICRAEGIPIGHAFERIPQNTDPVWLRYEEQTPVN